MRHPFITAAIGLLVVALATIAFTGAGGDEPPYEVDVVFDTAKGIVPGQLVKIAGARVGKVTDVTLTRERKARLHLEVESDVGPFRSDASCRILPEGFISENYVQCEPGDPQRPELASVGGRPTIPVQRTAVPVALQDVIDTFSLPVGQRVRSMVDTLGLATAGRGEDLNALLRRANPALTQVRSVLEVVDGERAALRAAVRDTDAVLDAVAGRREDLRGFVTSATATVRTTAARQRELAETIRRLPGTLTAVDDGLEAVDRTTRAGTPLLRDLRAAAPGLAAAADSVTAFSREGRPAVRALASTTREHRGTLRDVRPVAKRAAQLAAPLEPLAADGRKLLDSMRDSGSIERTLRLLYTLSTVTGSYDGLSHIVSIFAGVYPQCIADIETPGCRHDFRAPGAGTIPVNDPRAASSRRTPSPASIRDLLDGVLK